MVPLRLEKATFLVPLRPREADSARGAARETQPLRSGDGLGTELRKLRRVLAEAPPPGRFQWYYFSCDFKVDVGNVIGSVMGSLGN